MSELSEKVAREIMARIVRREFSEEQPFPHEVDLCTEYGVSRVVIREAKKHLQALGMLQSRKKYGSVIMPTQNWNYFDQDLFAICSQDSEQANESMENYFMFRQSIEPPLAATVAKRHSPEFEERLRTNLGRMKEALDTRNEDLWLDADLKFHIEIYTESRNILALPLANLMRPLFLRGFAVGHDAWAGNWAKHADLTQAIMDGDAEQALHYTHIIVRQGHMDYKRLAREVSETPQTR